MKLYTIALRNISRNKRRTLLSASAIAVAAFCIVFLFGLIFGIINDMEYNFWTYTTGAIRVRNAEFEKYERLNPIHLALPEFRELIAKITANTHVTNVSPRINFPGRVPVGGIGSDEKVNVMGMGVDFAMEALYQDYERTLVAGRLPQNGTREALIGHKLATKINAKIGDTFTILSQSGTRGSNAYTFTVTGMLSLPVAGLEMQMIQIPLDTAQRFLWLPNQVQEILIKVDGDTPSNIANELKASLKSSVPLSILDFKKVNGMAAMMDVAVMIYNIIAIIFFLLASTVIINTTIMVIFERMREIGTLGAMGMTGKQLVWLFFLESLFISIAGTIAGIIPGMLFTAYLGNVGFSAMAQAMEGMDSVASISSVIYPVLNFQSTVLVFLYSIAVSIVATWWPSRRAARITPIEALRHV